MRITFTLVFLLLSTIQGNALQFETPSKNIQCLINKINSGSEIICVIRKRSGNITTSRPSNCSGVWGHTFYMRNRGSAQLICDNAYTSEFNWQKLGYNSTAQYSGISCTSTKKFLKCKNQDGNGFVLSRKNQTLLSKPGLIQLAQKSAPKIYKYSKQTEKIQRQLNQLGFNAGITDGEAGEVTLQAIRDFQKTKQMPATGYLTAEQTQILFSEIQSASDNWKPIAKAKGYEENFKKSRTLYIEESLVTLGFSPGEVDGALTDETTIAINAFQTKYGLALGYELSPEQEELMVALVKAKKETSPNSSSILKSNQLNLKTASNSHNVGAINKTADIKAKNKSKVTAESLGINGYLSPFRDRKLFSNTKGIAQLYETASFNKASHLNYMDWQAFMRLNILLAAPEIIKTNDALALDFSSRIFTEEKKKKIAKEHGVNFNFYNSQNKNIKGVNTQNLLPQRQFYENAERNLAQGVSSVLNTHLNEFTKKPFLTKLRKDIVDVTARMSPNLPVPIHQIYGLKLGEYDFDKQRFKIISVTGRGGQGNETPENTVLSSVTKGISNNFRGFKVKSNLKEFPIYIPAAPDEAKALIEKIKGHRGDPYRVIFLGLNGNLVDINAIASNKASARNKNEIVYNIEFTTQINSVNISIDQEFKQIIWTQEIQNDSAEINQEQFSVGQQSKNQFYSLNKLSNMLIDVAPEVHETLLPKTFQEQIDNERLDHSPFLLEDKISKRVIRDEVISKHRNVTTYDFDAFKSFANGQLSNHVDKNILLLPFRASVYQDKDGVIKTNPENTFDLIKQSIYGAGKVFNEFNSRALPFRNGGSFIRPDRMGARLGRNPTVLGEDIAKRHKLILGGNITNEKIGINVGILFAIKKDKFETNKKIEIPGGIQIRPGGKGNASNTYLPSGLRDNHITGHIRFSILNIKEVDKIDAHNNTKWFVIELNPEEMVLQDANKIHKIKFPATSKSHFKPEKPAKGIVRESAVSNKNTLAQSKRLDTETLELLVIKHAPNSLAQIDYKRMLVARWYYENPERKNKTKYTEGRFFEIGTNKPLGKAFDKYLPQFKNWMQGRASRLQNNYYIDLLYSYYQPGVTSLTRSRTDRGNSTTSFYIMQNCENSIKSFKSFDEPGYSRSGIQKNICKYLRQALNLDRLELIYGLPDYLYPTKRKTSESSISHNMSRHGTVGFRSNCKSSFKRTDFYCTAYYKALNDPQFIESRFILDEVFLIDKLIEVSAANVRQARDIYGKVRKTVRLELQIENIRNVESFSKPALHQAIESVNAFLKKEKIQHGKINTSIEKETTVPGYVVKFKLKSANIINSKTNEHLFNFKLIDNPTKPDEKLLKPWVMKITKPIFKPNGMDVVGLQLGMTFDEAEAIIKKHMDVGTVLSADRLSPNFDHRLRTRGFTSGRLYESKDGRETIALFDENPSAKGVVLGLTRELLVEDGAVSIDALREGMSEKYGPVTGTNRDGSFFWGEDNSYCIPRTSNYTRQPIWFDQDGNKVELKSFKLENRNQVALPYGDSINDLMNRHSCKQGLMGSLEKKSSKKWNAITQRLYNRETYRTYFYKSKKMFEKGVPSADKKAVEAVKKLKF